MSASKFKYCVSSETNTTENSNSLQKEENDKGRHLIAAQDIGRHEVVFLERPLCSLQSVENNVVQGVLVCRSCRAFLHGSNAAKIKDDDGIRNCAATALKLISGALQRQDLHRADDFMDSTPDQEAVSTQCQKQSLPHAPPKAQTYCCLTPCRQNCGEIFCSPACEEDFWPMHRFLCTGNIQEPQDQRGDDKELPDDEIVMHPLLEFKRHAIQNNEIFLVVADFIAAQLAGAQARSFMVKPELQRNNKWTDFIMIPWWTVCTEPLLQSDVPFAFTDVFALYQSLVLLCRESSRLLRDALLLYIKNSDDNVPQQEKYRECLLALVDEIVTEHFFARVIGCFEQNAIGIRMRNPLCREILCNENFRRKHHETVLTCLERAGFIGSDDEEDEKSTDENKDCIRSDRNQCDENVDPENEDQKSLASSAGQWDYSPNEIASFLAGLEIGEFGDAATSDGDDLDRIFAPLDGTALYSMGCKMNHSCNPNMMVIYRNIQVGGLSLCREPMVAHFVALRNIACGEELCISYIDCNLPVQARQEALAHYGFTCECDRCVQELREFDDNEANGIKPDQNTAVMDDLFGDDDDDDDGDDLFGKDSDEEETKSNGEASADGEVQLRQKIQELDEIVDQSPIVIVPISVLAQVFNFIIQTGTDSLKGFGQEQRQLQCDEKDLMLEACECISAAKCRSFTSCRKVGMTLHAKLYDILERHGSWPNESYMSMFWCACLVGAVGCLHCSEFLQGQALVDKALILGLPRSSSAENFVALVESYANTAYRLPLAHCGTYGTCDMPPLATLMEHCLPKPIPTENCIREVYSAELSESDFSNDHVSKAIPLVVRGFAADWAATSCWRHFDYFAREHGHRIVPIELGSMLDEQSGMKETLMNLRDFVRQYIAPSCAHGLWKLDDSSSTTGGCNQGVAYLAQHELLKQISELSSFINPSPSLCGKLGPTQRNVWMGTGGTRTPLHYDSYDNLLVQIVGAKYVRLYASTETPKLYVSSFSSSHASQGNMSPIDCEREDFSRHPLARDASYQEVVLMPGDCIFIPSRMWHYVRSLSTSISVNYWW